MVLRLMQPGDSASSSSGESPPPGPVCPDGLPDDVRAVWNYTVAHTRNLTAGDRDTLLVYCQAVVTHRKACDVLARSPVLVPGAIKGTVTQNPAVRVQRDAAAIIRAFGADFGLTPAARNAGVRPAGDLPHLRELA